MICPSCKSYVSGSWCKTCDYILVEKKKPVKAIKKRSEKRVKEEKEYKELRKVFLKENPYCQAKLIGCTIRSFDLHHKAKRGINYLNKETFLAVCRNCHNKIHNVLSAKESKDKGLLI